MITYDQPGLLMLYNDHLWLPISIMITYDQLWSNMPIFFDLNEFYRFLHQTLLLWNLVIVFTSLLREIQWFLCDFKWFSNFFWISSCFKQISPKNKEFMPGPELAFERRFFFVLIVFLLFILFLVICLVFCFFLFPLFFLCCNCSVGVRTIGCPKACKSCCSTWPWRESRTV